jgi:hypothetical protein
MRLAVAPLAGVCLLLVASGASAHQIDPPSWWNDGRAEIEKRGGKCETASYYNVWGAGGGYFYPVDPDTRQPTPRGNYTENSLTCERPVPLEVAKAIKFGNPNATAAKETCSATAQESDDPAKRKFDEYAYLCFVFANPGTEAKPNRASWVCEREKYHIALGQGETADNPVWTARKTSLFPKRSAPTLARCVAPRAALDDTTTPARQAQRKGVRLPVTCSSACQVEVTGGARPLRKHLAEGRRTVLRIPLAGGGKLRVRVSAGGYRSSASVRVSVRGKVARVNAPAALVLTR